MRDKRGFKYCIEYSDDEVLWTSDDCVEVNKIKYDRKEKDIIKREAEMKEEMRR